MHAGSLGALKTLPMRQSNSSSSSSSKKWHWCRDDLCAQVLAFPHKAGSTAPPRVLFLPLPLPVLVMWPCQEVMKAPWTSTPLYLFLSISPSKQQGPEKSVSSNATCRHPTRGEKGKPRQIGLLATTDSNVPFAILGREGRKRRKTNSFVVLELGYVWWMKEKWSPSQKFY